MMTKNITITKKQNSIQANKKKDIKGKVKLKLIECANTLDGIINVYIKENKDIVNTNMTNLSKKHTIDI